MKKISRPLSPHLQIFRWHIAMFTSIAYRAAGIGLVIGAMAATVLLACLAFAPETYETLTGLLDTVLGKLILVGFTWALFFQLLQAVRHLCWDAAVGLELKTAQFTGWLIIWGSIALTTLVWVYLLLIA